MQLAAPPQRTPAASAQTPFTTDQKEKSASPGASDRDAVPFCQLQGGNATIERDGGIDEEPDDHLPARRAARRPPDLVEEAGIEDGEELVFEKHDGAVVVRRALSSDAVDAEIAAGEVHRTDSLDEFFAELDSGDDTRAGLAPCRHTTGRPPSGATGSG